MKLKLAGRCIIQIITSETTTAEVAWGTCIQMVQSQRETQNVITSMMQQTTNSNIITLV